MHPTRAERPTQLYLEIGGRSLSVRAMAVTVVFVLVVGMLATSLRKNNARAEDWRRRAVAAEEIIGGLRVVIAERSQALNARTVQANTLAAGLDTSRGALRETKSSVGSLTKRQQELAADKAETEKERQKLQTQQTALVSTAAALDACSEGLATLVQSKPKPKPADVQLRLTQCGKARERFETLRTEVAKAKGPVG
jgi:hypothetical protein